MASRLPGSSTAEADQRNRRTLRALLGIVLVLALATLLAGIRW
jgi:hypothetical protein